MRWTYLVCLLGVVAWAGCDSGSGTVPVTGTVMLDGQPLADANVIFAPSGKGQAAAGKTDENGKFSVSCAAGQGAMPGSYKVAITKMDPKVKEKLAAGGSDPADAASQDAAYEAAEASGVDLTMGARPTGATSLVPSKYTNPATSGLTAQVPESGQVELEPFELTSD